MDDVVKGSICGADQRDLSFPGWELYNECLDHHPITTKAFTSLTGWFLGDLLTQVGASMLPILN